MKLPLPRNPWSPANRGPDIEPSIRLARGRKRDDDELYRIVARDYSFAVPSPRLIRRIIALGPLVDVGAGNGYWAYRISRAGGDIVALEPRPNAANPVFPTYRADHTALSHPKLHGRALLMVWPTLGESWAAEAVALHTGTAIAYLGDRDFERTASPALPIALADHGYVETDRIVVDSWPWVMHDDLIIYTRPAAP